jgi:hypothetical protein
MLIKTITQKYNNKLNAKSEAPTNFFGISESPSKVNRYSTFTKDGAIPHTNPKLRNFEEPSSEKTIKTSESLVIDGFSRVANRSIEPVCNKNKNHLYFSNGLYN